ncbi:MAG: acyl carrier protein [Calothrix sp. SM1_7_51]|nr:acyl carrier protein [Calothrix sp. SM1_7_51]
MNTIKAIFSDLGIPDQLLHQDNFLRKDLQLDSTETIEVALALKRQLGINMKLETSEDITLGQLCHLVETTMVENLKNSP